MSKLRIINQPLVISGLNLEDLNDEISSQWDHVAENLEIKNSRDRKKMFKAEL